MLLQLELITKSPEFLIFLIVQAVFTVTKKITTFGSQTVYFEGVLLRLISIYLQDITDSLLLLLCFWSPQQTFVSFWQCASNKGCSTVSSDDLRISWFSLEQVHLVSNWWQAILWKWEMKENILKGKRMCTSEKVTEWHSEH